VEGCVRETLGKLPPEYSDALTAAPLVVTIEAATPIAGSWAVFSPPQAAGQPAEIILGAGAVRLTCNRVMELLGHEFAHALLYFVLPELYAKDHEAKVRELVTEWGLSASSRLVRRDYD